MVVKCHLMGKMVNVHRHMGLGKQLRNDLVVLNRRIKYLISIFEH